MTAKSPSKIKLSNLQKKVGNFFIGVNPFLVVFRETNQRTMKNVIKSLFLGTVILLCTFAQAQELERNLDSFNKVVVSPRINVVLRKGERESIRIKYSNVDADKINFEVINGRLRIYLDEARFVERNRRHRDGNYSSNEKMYRDASITAYITYRELKVLDVRGEEEITCDGAIDSERFKLKIYGEAEVTLASLHTKRFKAVLYGENKLRIKDGQTGHQRYRIYGVNKIDTHSLSSETVSTTIYGEGRLSVHATDEIRINAFGEPQVNVSGNSHISRGIIIGRADIRLN